MATDQPTAAGTSLILVTLAMRHRLKPEPIIFFPFARGLIVKSSSKKGFTLHRHPDWDAAPSCSTST
jgi:hypothetical protein